MTTKKTKKSSGSKKPEGTYYTPSGVIESQTPGFSLAFREHRKKITFADIYEMACGACTPLTNALELAKSKASGLTGENKATASGLAGNLASALLVVGGVLGKLKVADDAMED